MKAYYNTYFVIHNIIYSIVCNYQCTLQRLTLLESDSTPSTRVCAERDLLQSEIMKEGEKGNPRM